jgi:hypothetical protein
MRKNDEYELFIELENSLNRNQRLMIEPFADEFDFPNNSVIKIHLIGPTPIPRAIPRVEQTEKGTLFYVWPRTVYEVFCDGKLVSRPISECMREKVPFGFYRSSD